MIERAKNRGCALVAGMLLLLPGAAHAQLGTWATDPAVGASDLDVTIQISCAAPSFVCSLVDGYADTQTSSLSGSGGLLVDAPLGTLRFETDGLQDWGTGPQPVYNLFSGGSMIFASVPFAGVPQIASLLVFASSDPLIPVPGFFDLGPGDYPFSQSVPYGLLADIVGDMELNVPDIVSPPQSILLTGTLRILGDIDLDGMVEYELTQFSAVQSLQQPGNIGGELVLRPFGPEKPDILRGLGLGATRRQLALERSGMNAVDDHQRRDQFGFEHRQPVGVSMQR